MVCRLQVLYDHVNLFLLCRPVCHFNHLLPLPDQEHGKELMRVLLGGLKVLSDDIKLGIVGILLYKCIHNILPQMGLGRFKC